MQRQNNILKQKKRPAFAMILAIALIILIATVMVATLSVSAESSQRNIDAYLHEQEYFITKSATEMALLMVSEHNRSSGCLNSINLQYPPSNTIFDVNITIQYIGLNCSNAAANLVNNIDTAESRGTMVIDVVVTPNENINITTPLSFHKRTIQKL